VARTAAGPLDRGVPRKGGEAIVPFQPSGGLSLSVASFNIVIIGGMGSLVGAFLGGLLVSMAESLGAVFLSPSMKELVSFSLLIAILLLRPAGLFGRVAP
jgi:branched-chain amino acid transport system permease protein